MQKSISETTFDPRVAIAELGSAQYPEAGRGSNEITGLLEKIAGLLGWSSGAGSFGNVVPPNGRVLVKPNLVLHQNEGPFGIEPLVTHPSIIRTVVEELLKANPVQVLVGDAPIQSCDFQALMNSTGLDRWSADLAARDSRFKGLQDFRRTVGRLVGGVRVAEENLVSEDQFVLFDLGDESLLEVVTDEKSPFRVTWYDPRLMARTHAPRRHQYLVARAVLEADLIVNLPKLKTHKKAGVTCALKNLIGINGNKEYLPHHRLGGSATGGDCYPGSSPVKRALEYVADRQNLTTSYGAGQFWHGLTFMLTRVSRLGGDRLGYEGSWSGNDTIWRTCLDLNRILIYGRADGTLGDEPQRRVVHLADAIIAGQGNGPLMPESLPLGLLVGAFNAAAMDWVGAQLLGYDPTRIRLVRESFAKFRWPITAFNPEDGLILGDRGQGVAAELLGMGAFAPAVAYPVGWRDAAALRPSVSTSSPAPPVAALSQEG